MDSFNALSCVLSGGKVCVIGHFMKKKGISSNAIKTKAQCISLARIATKIIEIRLKNIIFNHKI